MVLEAVGLIGFVLDTGNYEFFGRSDGAVDLGLWYIFVDSSESYQGPVLVQSSQPTTPIASTACSGALHR